MSFELPGAGAPEELPCRYGASKMMCRGPRKSLDTPYVAFLGESETYGKFVDRPFVTLVEQELSNRGLNTPCVNLGSVNAGLDAYVHDPEILRLTAGARLAVIQVMGAQNLTNRFYRVHPRRNDRFLEASPLLASIYSEVDFTEFHFNKHLLSTLQSLSPERFQLVQEELQQAWVARMRLLLAALPRKPLLLWLRYQPKSPSALGGDPLLINQTMIERLRPEVHAIVELSVKPASEAEGLDMMRFGPMQAPAAAHLIGPQTHRQIADHLTKAIAALL